MSYFLRVIQRLGIVWFLAALALAAYVAVPMIKRRALPLETSQALAGKLVAQRAGCFGCHGEGGHGGVPNPGSPETVPAYRGGILMMYAETDDEIREWILDGMPQRLRADRDFQESRKRATLRMPAFRGRFTETEVGDLVLYVKTAASLLKPSPGTLESRGFDVAFGSGCFGCHGDGGMGGVGNIGSLKGYIPSFWGEDFRELVRSDEELREWIDNGVSARLLSDPVARRYLQGQVVTMPAFKDVLGSEDIESLMAYVKWVNRNGWRPTAAR